VKIAALLLVCMPVVAAADDEPAPVPAPTPINEPPPSEAPTAPTPVPTTTELAEDIDALAEKQKKLEKAEHADAARLRVLGDLPALKRFINMYVDVGAFAVGGNGSGIRSDVGHLYYPKYMGRTPGEWVFMGDPLSTAINSLGEPSDTSNSREVPVDTVNSEGRPSLLVNTIGLAIGKYIGHDIAVASLTQLLPRPDNNILDVQLAEIEYRPQLDDGMLRVSAGKVDSVLGIEYRAQDAPVRLGVTPSLIGRYTSGRPLGVRAQYQKGRLNISGTVANGDNFQPIFERETELKSNNLPTAAGHGQWMLPVGQGLEIGASGAIGPQDGQPDIHVTQWHLGFDAKLTDLHGFDAAAEYVQGRQEGKTASISMTACDVAPCLHYKGAYLLVDHRIRWWVTPYVRVDWRDAVHTKGAEFVYESHTIRGTFGVHFEMTSHIIAKIEYTKNHELGGIPQFADDILTSSLVVTTD